jgi:HD-GYP domain-containing protein (c-di-GMP phosphodiesterase class II)
MAGHVTLAQALSYARDLKALHRESQSRQRELEETNRELRRATRQAQQAAVDLRKTYRRLQRSFFQSLIGLANALEAKDPYTRGHSERVAGSARALGLAAGLSDAAAETVAQAGLLHDLGKIGIPEAILRKPGALSPEEWELMRSHPLTGAQIVAPLEFFEDGAVIVRHHHERLDGSGYPDRLAGAAIPVGARIVAIADVYDALTSDRPYRGALPAGEAIRQLRSQGGRGLDGELVECFVDVLGSTATGDASPERGL